MQVIRWLRRVASNVFKRKLDLLQCVVVLVLMKNRVSIISVLEHAMLSFTFMLLPEQLLVGKTFSISSSSFI